MEIDYDYARKWVNRIRKSAKTPEQKQVASKIALLYRRALQREEEAYRNELLIDGLFIITVSLAVMIGLAVGGMTLFRGLMD